MVQIHKVEVIPNVPLTFVEDRQPFATMDHALVKPYGSKVYTPMRVNEPMTDS